MTEWRGLVTCRLMTDKMSPAAKKKLAWITTPIILLFFAYSFWDAYKMSTRPRPLTEEQWKKEFINVSVKSETFKMVDSVLALKIVLCIYEKSVAKFGYDSMRSMDSKAGTGDTAGIMKLFLPIYSSCEEPFKDELYKSKFINSISIRMMKKGLTKKQGKDYASCFFDFLVSKYNLSYDHPVPDSILKSESIQAKKCFNRAMQKK